MFRTVIESPFKFPFPRMTSSIENSKLYKKYLSDLMLFCLNKGEAPFASHALYTQVLDDSVLDQRVLGIEASLAWGEAADKVVVGFDYGLSHGMILGIERHRHNQKKIEFVSLLKHRTEGIVAYLREHRAYEEEPIYVETTTEPMGRLL